MKSRIFAFHLLNDFSGSPKVLAQVLTAWVESGADVHLYTSIDRQGFLSDTNGVHYHKGWYRYAANPWLRLLFYTLSQLILLVRMYPKLRKTDIVYVNTVLPFGAAILGKIKGCRVVFHIHESTINPQPLKWFLQRIVCYTADELVFVSAYAAQSHPFDQIPSQIMYNAIEDKFIAAVVPKPTADTARRILMICSLKIYKGVPEFLALAQRFPSFEFRLVLNASLPEIQAFFEPYLIPANLEIFPGQSNVHPFYAWADVLVNLSRPDGWIETFGLTVLEGMAYGLPAIVPPLGGITEVVENGVTGIYADSRSAEESDAALRHILDHPTVFREMSANARLRLEIFRESSFRERCLFQIQK